MRLYPGVETPLKDKGPEEIDYVVVRENSGDMYAGGGGIMMKGTPHEVAVQNMLYSRAQVDRCLRWAFEYTRQHGKKARGIGPDNTLGLVGKTNVLTYVYDLWFRRFNEIGDEEYPDVKREYYHVDATCMWMVKSPEWFDVLVTGNMFGDIITDLGAITQGGMGVAAGGNINPEGVSMFEPIGGSAPKYTGHGRDQPHRRHRGRRDDARHARREPGGAGRRARRDRGHRHQDEGHGLRPDGLLDERGRRPRGRTRLTGRAEARRKPTAERLKLPRGARVRTGGRRCRYPRWTRSG